MVDTPACNFRAVACKCAETQETRRTIRQYGPQLVLAETVVYWDDDCPSTRAGKKQMPQAGPDSRKWRVGPRTAVRL